MKFLVLWAVLIAAAVTSYAPALAQTAAGVGAALTAPDNAAVTLSGVLVTSADANERRLVVRESADPSVEIPVFASISIFGIQRDQPVDVAGYVCTLADGARAIEGAMVYAYVDAEGKVFPMPAPPGVGAPAIPDADVGRGRSAMTEDEGGGTPSGSPCAFAWLATVADALAVEDGDRIGLQNKRIVAAGTDLNYQYYIDIADDGGQDVLRIYCTTAATTSQRVARVAGVITVDGNDINLSAGDGPYGGVCGQQQPWLADPATVGIARTLPDGAIVAFDDLVVTHESSSGAYLYAQDESRAAGIRVNRGEVTTSVTSGDTVDVLGELGHIAATGEQFVDASSITVTGSVSSLRPVTVSHRAIGGNGFDIGGLAPPTVGLFVKTFAKVTAKGADYLDVTDFTRVNPPDDTRVYLPGAPSAAIQVGDWAEITGVATVTSTGSPPVLTPGILVQSLEDVQLTNVAVEFTYPDPGPYGHPRAEGVAYTVGPGSIAGVVARTCDTCDWENAVFVQETGRWAFSIPEPYGISDVTVKATDSYGRWATAFKQVKPVTVLTGAESAISPFVYGTAITWRAKINGKKNGAAGGDGVLRKTGPDGDEYDWDSYVLDGLSQLRPGSLRFGDATSNTYKWRFGVGPQSGRPPLYVRQDKDDVSLNAYGTDEHLRLCELLDAEPIIPLPWQAAAPYGIPTAINESVNWVRYCTELHPLDEDPPRQPDPAWTASLIDFGVLLPLYDNANPGQYEVDDEVRIDTMNAMVPEDSRTVPGHTLAFTCIADTAGTEAGVSAPYYGSNWRTYWAFRAPVETRPTGAYLSTDSNVPAGYWGWLRALFNPTHRQPYATTYWEVGNQVFQLSTVEAEDYAALFNSYAQALRGAYPAIQLGACIPTWREDQHSVWPAFVLNPQNAVDFDYIVPHFYVATQTADATQLIYDALFNDIIESKVGGNEGDLQLFRDLAFPNSVSLWPTEHNTMFGLFEYAGQVPVVPFRENFKLKSALAVAALQMKLVAEHAQGFNLFHACAVSHGNLADNPQTERTIVVDLVREPRLEEGIAIPSSERRWVTPTFHAQLLLSHFGRGAAVATDAAYQAVGERDVFVQVFRQDEQYRLILLNTNATEERVQSIYLGEGAEPVGGLITYTLQANAESPMEASNEPADQNQVGLPAPGYYVPLETNYFVWSLPPASMTVMDIQLASETSEPRNLMGRVVCPETMRPLGNVTIDALVNDDVQASATTNDFGVYEFRGLPAGSYDLRVNAAGYDVFEPSVVIEPGEYYGLVFEAQPTLSGWVLRYGSGAPVEGALVWAEGTDYVTQADADGFFTLCLPPGGYTLRATTRSTETPTVGVCSGSVTIPTLPTPQCVEIRLDPQPLNRTVTSCY